MLAPTLRCQARRSPPPPSDLVQRPIAGKHCPPSERDRPERSGINRLTRTWYNRPSDLHPLNSTSGEIQTIYFSNPLIVMLNSLSAQFRKISSRHRYLLSWLLATGTAAGYLNFSWHHFDEPKRPDGNRGHTYI